MSDKSRHFIVQRAKPRWVCDKGHKGPEPGSWNYMEGTMELHIELVPPAYKEASMFLSLDEVLDLIRANIKESGLTQKAWALKLDMYPSNVSRILYKSYGSKPTAAMLSTIGVVSIYIRLNRLTPADGQTSLKGNCYIKASALRPMEDSITAAIAVKTSSRKRIRKKSLEV